MAYRTIDSTAPMLLVGLPITSDDGTACTPDDDDLELLVAM
jgi:hypothetical protein